MPQPLTIAIAAYYMLTTSLSSVSEINATVPRNLCNNNPDSIKPKIQVAILLDVSNSMDGLIIQAKGQLWNMVKVLGKVKCGEVNPQIEIALYEYGRATNDIQQGYTKKILGFTSDLDKLYYNLGSLITNGGYEFCPHVISTSIDSLNWDISNKSYKVIFIAGNESFLQGNITYTEACKKANEKGIIINTIFCGEKEKGINEHWKLGAECGNGSFTNIDQNAKEENTPTPYDSTLFVLNGNLNDTYIPYGINGSGSLGAMMQTDTAVQIDTNDPSKIINYIVVKSNIHLYDNSAWDLVDAIEKDTAITDKVDMKTLPDSLLNKTRAELKRIVISKSAERNDIKKQIAVLNTKREDFINKMKSKTATPASQTLESEIEKIISEQVSRFNMQVQ